METSELKALLPRLQSWDFSAVTDEQLPALARLYCSLYDWADIKALDDSSISPVACSRRLQELLERIDRICQTPVSSDNIAVRADLLVTRTLLRAHPAVQGRSEGDGDEWSHTEETAERFLCPDRAPALTPAEEFSLLQLVFCQWYGYQAEEEEVPPTTIACLRRRLEQWISDLLPEGRWERISRSEALDRLQILAQNAAVLLDERYDAQLLGAAQYYSRTAMASIMKEPLTDETASILIRCYRLEQQLPFPLLELTGSTERICRLLKQWLPPTPPKTTLQIHGLAVVTEYLCWKITAAML